MLHPVELVISTLPGSTVTSGGNLCQGGPRFSPTARLERVLRLTARAITAKALTAAPMTIHDRVLPLASNDCSGLEGRGVPGCGRVVNGGCGGGSRSRVAGGGSSGGVATGADEGGWGDAVGSASAGGGGDGGADRGRV